MVGVSTYNAMQALIGYAATLRRENTSAWMDGFVERMNTLLYTERDRRMCEWDPERDYLWYEEPDPIDSRAISDVGRELNVGP